MKVLNFANVAGKNRGGGVHEVVYSFFRVQNTINIDAHLWFPGFISEEEELKSELPSTDKKKVKALPTFLNPNFGLLKDRAVIKKELSNFDVIHQHGAWLPISKLCSFAKKNTGAPFLLQPHGYFEPYRLGLSKTKKKMSYFLFEKRNIELSDILVACSHDEYEKLRELFPSKDIAIIPNGVSESFLKSKSKGDYFHNKKFGEKKNMLFLSRIHSLKGLERLFEVFSELETTFRKHWNLVIAGEGEAAYIDSLKDLVTILGIKKNVFFEGPVFGEDKINIMSSANFFVLPTFNENYGIVIAESLSKGVPAITTKGAPWSLLNQENCGLWVDNDNTGIKNGLIKAFNMTEEEMSVLKTNCLKVSKEHFLWENIVPKTKELYKWLLKEIDEKPNFVFLGDKSKKNPDIFNVFHKKVKNNGSKV